MICKNCNQENEESNKFCIKCGLNLKKGNYEKQNEILSVPNKVEKHTFRNAGITIAIISLLAIISYTFSVSSNTTSSTSYEWKPFTSVEHKMVVNLPKYPTTSREPAIKLESGISYSSTTYSSEDDNGVGYSITVGDYNIEPKNYDNKTGLEGSINGMKDIGELNISNTNFTKQNGLDAITFSFTATSIEYSGKGIAIIRDNLEFVKSYIIFVGSKTGDIPDYQKFINSLEFIN